MGLYKKSSVWYKKITIKYPKSTHLNKSISYYLNSLVITGKVDSARIYTQKFKEQYPKLNFNNEFINKKSQIDKGIENNKIVSNNIITDNIKYSVQVGTYKSYQSAISKKRIFCARSYSRMFSISICTYDRNKFDKQWFIQKLFNSYIRDLY